MQEYSNVNELLANAQFAKNEPIWGYVTDQNVDVMRFSNQEYIRWDFILRNGKDIHFQESAEWLRDPRVLTRHKQYILEVIQKAEQR